MADIDMSDSATEAVNELGTILAQLEQTPNNLTLLQRQISLLQSLSMTAEVLDCISRLSSLVMLSQETWLIYFDLAGIPSSLDGFVEILEKFEAAEGDYLSLSILSRHAETIITCSNSSAEDLSSFLTPETVRGMLRGVVGKGNSLLSSSRALWQIWLDWELAQPLNEDHVAEVHLIFLERMAIPDLALSETSTAYSSFCTEHCPGEYEKRMIAATAASQSAKAILGEKRFQKTREDCEQELVTNGIAAYPEYIAWETRFRKNSTSDPVYVRGVYERAIAAYSVDPAYKTAEAALWLQYMAAINDPTLHTRATRACPSIAAVWSKSLRVLEREGSDLADTFDLAISLGAIIDVTELFAIRAGIEIRADSPSVLATISTGLEGSHDASFRLEKLLLDWAETRAPEMLDAALMLVDKPNKARSSSYQMILLRANVDIRRGRIETARSGFIAAIQRSDLDWPEAVYEAYLQFESVHGTSGSLDEAEERVKKEGEKVARRREKQAQAYQSDQPVEQVQDAPVAPRVEETVVKRIPASTDAAAIERFFEECGAIRETTILEGNALVEFQTAEAIPAALSRDHKRIDETEVSVGMLWRSTLYVTNFPSRMDDAGMRALFAQYGTVLQTRWPSRKYDQQRKFCYVTMTSQTAAEECLVLNGMQMEGGFGIKVAISDPAARVARTDAGESTLFVGGLTAKTTEADVRGLLKEYTVVNVKLGWNAIEKVCKGFAFVDMATEADAQAALALHGTKVNGRMLKVEVADRNHANKRSTGTDASRIAAERRARSVKLYGLPEGATEGLLQQALEKLVPVKRLEIFAKSREAVAQLESQADVGVLLLRTEPFVFEGATITFSEHTARPAKPAPQPSAEPSALAFAPRAARRPASKAGIGKGRPVPADKQLDKLVVKGEGAQDKYRAIVDLKNEQRKRAAEGGDDGEAKRAKQG